MYNTGEEGRAVLGIRFSVETSVMDQTLRKMRPKRMENLEAERKTWWRKSKFI